MKPTRALKWWWRCCCLALLRSEARTRAAKNTDGRKEEWPFIIPFSFPKPRRPESSKGPLWKEHNQQQKQHYCKNLMYVNLWPGDAAHAKRIGWAMNRIIYTSTQSWAVDTERVYYAPTEGKRDSLCLPKGLIELLSGRGRGAPMGRCQRRASASICWWWSRRKEQSDDNARDWANHFVPAHHRHHSLWQYWRVFHWFNHPRWMLGGCKIENRFRKFPPPSNPAQRSFPPTTHPTK